MQNFPAMRHHHHFWNRSHNGYNHWRVEAWGKLELKSINWYWPTTTIFAESIGTNWVHQSYLSITGTMVKSTVEDESRIPNVDVDDSIQTYYLRIIPHLHLRHPCRRRFCSHCRPSSSSILSPSLSSSYSSTGSIWGRLEVAKSNSIVMCFYLHLNLHLLLSMICFTKKKIVWEKQEKNSRYKEKKKRKT